MKRTNRRGTILLCSVAVAAMTSSAYAKPVHKKAAHRHSYHRQAASPAPAPMVGDSTFTGADRDMRYSPSSVQVRRSQSASAPVATRRARTAAKAQQPASIGGFSSSALVAEARKYLGTNPTGRSRLWCGAFMDLVLKRTGHAGGGNLAKAYANYGRRVSGPQVGAIAVMGRKGGGHVGVVSGVDPNGNPIIISGNHNRTTAESVYPRSRIIAYVLPGS